MARKLGPQTSFEKKMKVVLNYCVRLVLVYTVIGLLKNRKLRAPFLENIFFLDGSKYTPFFAVSKTKKKNV